MVPSLNTPSKLVMYIILITCVVFLMFELANEKGKRAGISETVSNLVSSPIVNISVSEAVVSDTSENVISTLILSDSDQQFESKDRPSSSHSEQILIKMNLMFIKTHKCGTSTLVDVFYLRGVRKKFNFVMIPYTHKLSSLTLRQVNS